MLVNRYADLAGVNIVPTALVGAVRTALANQGLDPAAINTDGSINPQGLLTSAFDTLEIRTTATAPIVVNLRGPPSPSAQALIDQFRPQIILSGRAGRFEFAPGGSGDQLDFSRSAMSLGLGLGAAILGVGLLGYALLRR